MLTEPGGPFIQLSRLNISKYAGQPSIAKPLFEYIYYHEHDVRYVSMRRVRSYVSFNNFIEKVVRY